ncbi:ABC transporter permease [Saccharopolyspora sp. NPDC047091]|uniref:ABC transporter permease n=1 Tax=Saccharopolyspora sp. NPDC047091 TaxID=3155924 RepID=UPI0033C58C92
MLPTSGSGSIPVTPALGAAVVLLLGTAASVVAVGGYGRWWPVLAAGARGAVQLLLVSSIIAQVVGSPVLVAPFITAMFAIAVRTAGRRVTTGPGWWWAAVPIAAGVGPVVAVLLIGEALPPTGLVLVPLVGQLIGGALTATSLAGRRLLDELHQRRGEVEAALVLGLTDREARLEIARPVAGGALVPALDQTRTAGTVTLPGAFVGMLLGGATPVEAGAVQLFVLIGLLAVESIAVLLTLHLVALGLLRGAARAPGLTRR